MSKKEMIVRRSQAFKFAESKDLQGRKHWRLPPCLSQWMKQTIKIDHRHTTETRGVLYGLLLDEGDEKNKKVELGDDEQGR